MALSEVLASEKEAISALSNPASLKAALEKLANSLEKLDLLGAPGFVEHLEELGKQGKQIPAFYGALPAFPKKPIDPYDSMPSSGDLPTHDSVIEYEDNEMFYRNECKALVKALAKACGEYSARLG